MAVNIIDDKTAAERTVRIFDSFYNWDVIVAAQEYDVVHSYFRSTIDNKTIADNFTAYIFRISHETGLYSLELLDYIRGKSQLDMNATIAYYLNSFKNKASLYGVALKPLSNQFVSRNIAV